MVDEDSVRHAKRVYGTNAFVIPLPTFYDLYLEQVQAPMFVFQMFCILLFCLDEYWYVNRHTVQPLLLRTFNTIPVHDLISRCHRLNPCAE